MELATQPLRTPPPASEPARRKVFIIIPAHNEESGIKDVIDDLRAALAGTDTGLLVVNDGSTDSTAEILEESGVSVVKHPTNRGYGASLKSGIREADSEFVLTMDADGQHRIEDVLKLLKLAEDPDVEDCVIGNRTALLHSPLWRMPGKWFLTFLAERLVQRKIPDLNSGLRLLRRSVALRYIRLCPQGFSFSTTITMAMLSRGYGVRFIPIKVNTRSGKSSVRIKTGFQTIMLVLRLATLFNPLRIFLPLSFLSALAGVGWAIPYLVKGQGVTVASMLMIVTAVIMFSLGLICDQVAQLRLERYE